MYYLSISGRFLNDFALLKFTYLGESWTFSLSVPEYILYGLGIFCFRILLKNLAMMLYSFILEQTIEMDMIM
ncbi:TA34L [Vaccinia virus Tian Tan]|uniref:TA34L n=1 Tax=Vaccinia virus (strain Tian Tan) TaxID=10253 RepID=Q9JF70_VACCT|nr:TA34L [Vaccinia virus Tian Tan]